jgi:hypothetical protein
VKEYAFTRVWAAFTLSQRELAMPQKDLEAKASDLANDPKLVRAIDRLASSVRSGGIDSITISTPGMDSVVIDKAAAEKIHRRAKRVT